MSASFHIHQGEYNNIYCFKDECKNNIYCFKNECKGLPRKAPSMSSLYELSLESLCNLPINKIDELPERQRLLVVRKRFEIFNDERKYYPSPCVSFSYLKQQVRWAQTYFEREEYEKKRYERFTETVYGGHDLRRKRKVRGYGDYLD
jgi:hypothetical protein